MHSEQFRSHVHQSVGVLAHEVTGAGQLQSAVQSVVLVISIQSPGMKTVGSIMQTVSGEQSPELLLSK